MAVSGKHTPPARDDALEDQLWEIECAINDSVDLGNWERTAAERAREIVLKHEAGRPHKINSALLKTLKAHHERILGNGTIGLPDGKGGWIEVDDGAEYSDSGLYEMTVAALAEAPSEERPTTDGTCFYGDPTCPCQDGDACHYEGADPMAVRPEYVRSAIATANAAMLEALKAAARWRASDAEKGKFPYTQVRAAIRLAEPGEER